MAVDLTVIIPTVPGREHLLSRLLWTILEQPAAAGVDLLVIDGHGLLGDKVNLGVFLAAGRHVTVVDDDDMLAACYFDEVRRALTSDPDFVGFNVLELEDGRYSNSTAIHGDGTWGRHIRGPSPKGVLRTSIAAQLRMKNHYTADRAWTAQAAKLVTSHVFIDRHLYLYDWWRSTSLFFNGQPRDVGAWPFDETAIRRVSL